MNILTRARDDAVFAAFCDIALKTNIDLLLRQLLKETEDEILDVTPGNDPMLFHNKMLRLHNRRDLIQEQLRFFETLNDEFQSKSRRD